MVTRPESRSGVGAPRLRIARVGLLRVEAGRPRPASMRGRGRAGCCRLRPAERDHDAPGRTPRLQRRTGRGLPAWRGDAPSLPSRCSWLPASPLVATQNESKRTPRPAMSGAESRGAMPPGTHLQTGSLPPSQSPTGSARAETASGVQRSAGTHAALVARRLPRNGLPAQGGSDEAHRHVCIVMILAAGSLVAHAQGERGDWPEWRKDHSRTASQVVDIPIDPNQTNWVVEIEGGSYSGGITLGTGNTLLVKGSGVPPSGGTIIHFLDRTDGSVIWKSDRFFRRRATTAASRSVPTRSSSASCISWAAYSPRPLRSTSTTARSSGRTHSPSVRGRRPPWAR